MKTNTKKCRQDRRSVQQKKGWSSIGYFAQESAVLSGDWIAAAMAVVSLEGRWAKFDRLRYRMELNQNGLLVHLDPAIKKAAMAFGLNKSQAERFYGRATKHLARKMREAQAQSMDIVGKPS